MSLFPEGGDGARNGVETKRAGRAAEERGEEGSGAGVGPLMDLKCCHCADEMRMAKARRTMERERRKEMTGGVLLETSAVFKTR